nr:MAG TPA: hypothetical protein [Caudoviricetes sp.]
MHQNVVRNYRINNSKHVKRKVEAWLKKAKQDRQQHLQRYKKLEWLTWHIS